MDKLKMHSPDLTEANIDKLAQLFPGCVTEAADGKGGLKKAIDFDLLRQELSGHLVEGPQERYQLNWPGKREALLAANAPIAKTLRPVREESVDFDTTRNLFIEGDNLEALKLIQEYYQGKIGMIYIDPPYNTGKDFIYKDDFSESSASYLARSNQRDVVGGRLLVNEESSGRFHSNWLSMLYPRIRIARGLLSDGGAIFISINHREVAGLKLLCDEIFGQENLLCMFAWRTDGNFDNQAKFKYCHEYILAYAKNEGLFPCPNAVDPNTGRDSKIFLPEIRNTIVKNGPKNPISTILLPKGFPCSFESGVIQPRDDSWPRYLGCGARVLGWKLSEPVEVRSGWSSKDLLMSFLANGCREVPDAKGQLTTFQITETGAIEAIKKRGEPSHVISLLSGLGGPQKAAGELAGIEVVFDDYPKPLELLKYLIRMVRGDDLTVLDFFSGSSSTAHAVMDLNAADGGSRRYVMVQLPEPCAPNTPEYKFGFKNIAEIGRERIRRAGKKILAGDCNPNWNRDVGFRALKIDSSNMQDVYYSPDAMSQDLLSTLVDNIRADRTPEDLLFQVLLDWGVDLALPIRQQSIAGKQVFFVDDNALLACFDQGIDEDFVRQIATHQPLRVVFRDNGFASDSVKINVEQLFRQLSPITEIRTL